MTLVANHTSHGDTEHSPEKFIITNNLINELHIIENTLNDLTNSLIAYIDLIANVPHLNHSEIYDHIIYLLVSDPT